VCQIITFGKMKARAALRDVARVLDLPLSEADKVAKKVPAGPNVTLTKAIKKDPDLAEVPRQSELHREWFDLALKVEGLARHSSKHAAGVVIADCPLREIVPLSRQEDAIITQWDMKSCEKVGLLKMDFLGLRTLSILNHARIMAHERSGVDIDLDALPLDDPAVYELICNGDTEGIFQLESPGMRRLLTEVKPSCYEDVIAVLALYRPGPLNAGDNKVYARRKHGQEKVVYDHPLLEGALKETYGVLLYQEQIMRVVQILGGFSLSEADILRKAMSKKKRSLMAPYKKKFLDGSLKQGVSAPTANMIWEKMDKFADYGFNKSHSTGYARVTYQTAWMKVHHLPEFYAATFTYEAADTDKLRTLIEDARHHGIRVLPPCVNHSSPSFSVSGDKTVRYGLSAVKGIGSGASEVLCGLRKQQENGRFPCLEELLTVGGTASLNKTTFESLIKAGACDVFQEARVDMLDRLAIALRAANARAEDRRRGQGLLFEAPAAALQPSPELDREQSEESVHHAPRPLSEQERKLTLALEKEALGLFLTHHPLDPYRDVLEGISPYHSRNLSEAPSGSVVHLAGIATQVQIRPTRKDPARKFARFRVEDLYGSTAAIAFPPTVEKFRDWIQEDFIGDFCGRVDQAEKEPVLLVEKIEPLGNPDQIHLNGSLEIFLPANAPPLESLRETLERYRGSSIVRFLYQDQKGRTVVHRAGPEWRVDLATGLFRDLEKILGPGKARIAGSRETPQYETRSSRFRRARARTGG
ncbi:MAG: DNA polymerase III subunit alpha, partial [Planctomycetota bacterium]